MPATGATATLICTPPAAVFAVVPIVALLLGLLALVSSPTAAAATGEWSSTGSLNLNRYQHTATLLPNGRVLAAGGRTTTGPSFAAPRTGSAELYNPAVGTWFPTGAMQVPRSEHTATLLTEPGCAPHCGKVLVVGGLDNAGSLTAAAELYDPGNGTWSRTGSLNIARINHTATLLSGPNCAPNCGKVLVVGGGDGPGPTSAELYAPAATGGPGAGPGVSGAWSRADDLDVPHTNHSATLLPNGDVLVAGGGPGQDAGAAELYSAGIWRGADALSVGRSSHAAALLAGPNCGLNCGKVLVVGGPDQSSLQSAELYDPAPGAGTWQPTGMPTKRHFEQTADLLPDGTILVTNDLYDPAGGGWTSTGSLNTARSDYTTTLLPSGPRSLCLDNCGKVLAAGGLVTTNSNPVTGFSGTTLSELYTTPPAVALDPVKVDFGEQAVNTTSGPRSLKVTNAGATPLTISTTAISGAHASDFAKSADTCSGATVAPGDSCAIGLTFTPTALEARSAAIAISNNARGSPHQVPLQGTGTPTQPARPVVAVSPTSLDFGDQAVNTTSSERTVTVTNSGDAALTVSSTSISGANASEFARSSDSCASATVAPGDSCTVGIRFTPAATGARSATLAFADNAEGSPHQVPLRGTGTQSGPGFSADPTSVDYVDQPVGTSSSERKVTVTNSGDAALTVSATGVGGSHPSDFTISSDTCKGATVAPGASCAVGVRFTPTATGARSATLAFTDNAEGSPHQVPLRGTGTPAPRPAFNASPSNVEFGDQAVGTTSAERTVTVTNGGNGPLSISATGVTGAQASEFAKSSDSCKGMSLAPGASCTVGVRFAPGSTGVRSASLDFTDNAEGSPHQVPLSGNGTAVQSGSGFSANPSSVDFGGQEVGTTAERTVTVTNPGNATLTISATGITGSNAADFAISSDTCRGASVAPGASCTVGVTFTPAATTGTQSAAAATGGRSAALAFTDNAQGSPHQVALRGTATAPAGSGGSGGGGGSTAHNTTTSTQVAGSSSARPAAEAPTARGPGPTPAAKAADDETSASGQDSSDPLAATGMNVLELVAMALLVIVSGATMLVASEERRSREAVGRL